MLGRPRATRRRSTWQPQACISLRCSSHRQVSQGVGAANTPASCQETARRASAARSGSTPLNAITAGARKVKLDPAKARVLFKDARLLVVKLVIFGSECVIASAYAPPVESREADLKAF